KAAAGLPQPPGRVRAPARRWWWRWWPGWPRWWLAGRPQLAAGRHGNALRRTVGVQEARWPSASRRRRRHRARKGPALSKPPSRRLAAGAAALALAATVGACAGDDTDGDGTATDTSSAATTTDTSSAPETTAPE